MILLFDLNFGIFMFAPGAVQTKKEHRQNYLLLTGGAEKSATYTIEHTHSNEIKRKWIQKNNMAC